MAIGDYNKTTYASGLSPAINAANLNNNENKVKELDTAVSGLETTVSGNTSNISMLETTVSGNTSNISMLETTVSGNTSNISMLETTVSGNTSNISMLETTVSGLETTVSGLETTVSGLETTVSGNTSNIKSLSNNIYWREGVSRGYSPGIIRSGLIPSKVVVIGNSMTAHGYAANIWPLTDRREMAASRPNSGWVSLLQQHLYKINPGVKVYKANGAHWEVATLGTRSYEDIQDQIIDEVKLDRPYPTSLLLDDVLDSNVDVIIVQLAENCADVTTKEDITTLITDYKTLYASLKKRSPNATIYQMSSFWVTTGKLKAMTAAARGRGVEFVNELAFLQRDVRQDNFQPMSNYEVQTGDPIYDEAGEVAFTVSATVAGHPNDKGFAIRATHAIFALYNSGSDMSNSVNRLHIKGDLTGGLSLRIGDEYTSPSPSSITDLTAFSNAYNTLLDRYLSPGFYAMTISFPSAGATHGLLEVRTRQSSGGLYNPTEQVVHMFNTSGKLIRNTSLSADDMVWTAWSVLN